MMTDDELAGFDPAASAGLEEFEPQPQEEETPTEAPPAAPAAPEVDLDALAEKLAAKMGVGAQPAQPQPQAQPKNAPPPKWDDFEGSLDEFVAAHVAYATNGMAKTSMVAMQENQSLAALAPSLPPEVSTVARQWLDQLPPEHLQPGVANAIVAHALGQYQLSQIMKGSKPTAVAPRAVADSGVPSAGFTSPEDASVLAGLKQAFPHLSAKDLAEIMKNGR